MSRTAESPRAWQRMLSGRRLDLLDPSSLDIEIGDIAHGLARVARWNGQTAGPHVFSVAQHSLLVEGIGRHCHPDATPAEGLEFLLHDAPEYVVGDIISPLKAAIGDAYKGVERRLLAAVRQRFGLPAPSPALARRVKRADRIAAHWEAVRLAGFSAGEAARYFGPAVTLPDPVLALADPWPTGDAQRRFLARFEELNEGSRRT
ncbi:5'-deoxynucleotidase YfbR-like HD superfamily hydrolase [Methylobacterium aerolatum]|uniref:5'-deoxynucleotidase YfbR-like HD superfamily hydrolase n=1 Tax=Methylobacterium aerolatum TaxID=418708 RepID=A0ABU0I4E4_9HYPH|nr:5'-deoxynucleotidase YfbR-like HD superfamily hydrolase [Methylobacterium aerolatum]